MNQAHKSMISHSSSFEDVILHRALQHVQNGCYVDVGASMPLGDNNTAAFYRKGWRGICLEPIPDFNCFWEEFRPEDILLNVAAGDTLGETTFYLYKNTSQISTCSKETMEHWKEFNYLPDQELVVPIFTLNYILEEYLGDRIIHLLAIDAEGFEKQVLKGFDLKKYCPWIIIVEATVPGTDIPSYQHWEDDVILAGYTMVYSDSINRFYLSNTKSELQRYFIAPPNTRDEFITLRQEMLMNQCEELQRVNESLNMEIESLHRQMARTWIGSIKVIISRVLNKLIS